MNADSVRRPALRHAVHPSLTYQRLSSYPVVAAVRDTRLVPDATASPVQTVFLMTGSLLTIAGCVSNVRDAGKAAFVHVDLLKGFSADKDGLQYLAQRICPDGIVSTKTQVLQQARRLGLATVQHLFIIDTQALHTGIRNVRDFGPDAIEIMPGVMPTVIQEIAAELPYPLVAAGLIRSPAEIRTALESGALAVAVGKHALWSPTSAGGDAR